MEQIIWDQQIHVHDIVLVMGETTEVCVHTELSLDDIGHMKEKQVK